MRYCPLSPCPLSSFGLSSLPLSTTFKEGSVCCHWTRPSGGNCQCKQRRLNKEMGSTKTRLRKDNPFDIGHINAKIKPKK